MSNKDNNTAHDLSDNVPDQWRLISNKYVFTIRKEQVGKQSIEYKLLSLTLNGVIERDMENPQGKFPAEFDTYQEVRKGDFIFCLFDVEETPRAVGLSESDGMITGAYTVMAADPQYDKRFLYYYYLNLDTDKRLRHLYKGLRNTIPKESFLSYKTLIPPIHEQTAIAGFLDRKTAQIDNAISIKERQIELLQERRLILVQNAVTRGLDPKVKMKEGGVEWIGEIPEHWEVRKLKYLFKLVGGGTPSKERSEFWNGNIPWVSPKDMKTDYIYSTEESITEKGLKNSTTALIEANTLLMVVRSGILQRKIPVAISKNRLSINQDMKAFIQKGNMSTNYLLHFVQGNDQFLRNDWVKQGATVESIEVELMKNGILLVPPESEQTAISEFVESVGLKIATAIILKEKEIEKLKEYKATLINGAVMGKTRVR